MISFSCLVTDLRMKYLTFTKIRYGCLLLNETAGKCLVVISAVVLGSRSHKNLMFVTEKTQNNGATSQISIVLIVPRLYKPSTTFH